MVKSSIKIFVHLAHGYGADSWNRRWRAGRILGINEPFPYGYYRAEMMGCSVKHSHDLVESAPRKLWRLAVRVIAGFDLVHAWRNFDGIRNADVVWTHTESQFLSILFLFRFLPAGARPRMISQSVWLFDRWPRFSGLRRWLFSKLLCQADVLTVHSPDNLAVARRLFPSVRSELLLFGIAADEKVAPAPRPRGQSLNIISLGNDEHRDWDLLISAVAARPNWSLKIASQKVRASAVSNVGNIQIVSASTNEELLALYRSADLLVLAIKPNLHASGVSVLQEAALFGIPVICSDTGGVNAYFNASQVRFVPPGDVDAIRAAIDELANNPEAALELARNAQQQMGPNGLSSEAFVRRHVELSRALLASERPSASQALPDQTMPLPDNR